jgi:hypothetical protein
LVFWFLFAWRLLARSAFVLFALRVAQRWVAVFAAAAAAAGCWRG